jgi:uncharacterized membrane protein (DUF106 family)
MDRRQLLFFSTLNGLNLLIEENEMKYAKLIIAALIVAWLVFLLMVNRDGLVQPLTLAIGVPFTPLTQMVMPVWVALILACTAAFIIAIVLELIVWYESERALRLQRIQIRKLQEALEHQKAQAPPSAP